MNYATFLGLASMIAGGTLLFACSNAEEFAVKGEVSSTESVSGPITVEFFEVDETDADAERESIYTITLESLGAIAETIDADPERTLVVQALVDADGNGACTEGELWGETVLVKNDDGTIADFVVALAKSACPTTVAE